MFSFKQLEALYWIATLGGFAPAARKLNTTQSAVSKRIKELETSFDTPLFDREQRQARLTEKGEEMLLIARRLLEQRDIAVEQFSKPEVIERRLRIGVTELTAMTWLPRLVRRIHQHYPRVVIEPDVDLSVHLRDKLQNDEMDAIIVPDAFTDPGLSALPLASVKSVWLARPGLIGDRKRPLRMHELASHTILTQGNKSGTGIIYDRWIKSQSIFPGHSLSCSSVVALIGLTVSGMGRELPALQTPAPADRKRHPGNHRDHAQAAGRALRGALPQRAQEQLHFIRPDAGAGMLRVFRHVPDRGTGGPAACQET